MAQVTLELDDRWFEVLAQSPTAVLTKHRVSGTLTLWRLEWRDRDEYPPGFESEAWAKYLGAANNALE